MLVLAGNENFNTHVHLYPFVTGYLPVANGFGKQNKSWECKLATLELVYRTIIKP